MLLTELMQPISRSPGRTLGEYLHIMQQVSTTEFLASLMDAVAGGHIAVTPSSDSNPLHARVVLAVPLQCEETQPIMSIPPEHIVGVNNVVLGTPPTQPETASEDQFAHNAKEAEADIVERYEAAQEAFKDMRARAEALSASLNTMRRHGTQAVSELTMLANALKDERPSMAEAILSAARLIPHE